MKKIPVLIVIFFLFTFFYAASPSSMPQKKGILSRQLMMNLVLRSLSSTAQPATLPNASVRH
jgi:hypothetical protein